MIEPTIANVTGSEAAAAVRFSAVGQSFAVHEWRGSGPAALHVHHADDEAWHVLDGMLRFRFIDRVVEVSTGGTVFVPAGVAHTYEALDARYLIVLTPRLAALIAELQQTSERSQHIAIYQRYDSELLEP
jgi:mannose-6-phosphate isomerase-like protein (cupin superfamily)